MPVCPAWPALGDGDWTALPFYILTATSPCRRELVIGPLYGQLQPYGVSQFADNFHAMANTQLRACLGVGGCILTCGRNRLRVDGVIYEESWQVIIIIMCSTFAAAAEQTKRQRAGGLIERIGNVLPIRARPTLMMHAYTSSSQHAPLQCTHPAGGCRSHFRLSATANAMLVCRTRAFGTKSADAPSIKAP